MSHWKPHKTPIFAKRKKGGREKEKKMSLQQWGSGLFILTEALSIFPLLANCVRCTQTLGHTKAVQAITHHGLS